MDTTRGMHSTAASRTRQFGSCRRPSRNDGSKLCTSTLRSASRSSAVPRSFIQGRCTPDGAFEVFKASPSSPVLSSRRTISCRSRFTPAAATSWEACGPFAPERHVLRTGRTQAVASSVDIMLGIRVSSRTSRILTLRSGSCFASWDNSFRIGEMVLLKTSAPTTLHTAFTDLQAAARTSASWSCSSCTKTFTSESFIRSGPTPFATDPKTFAPESRTRQLLSSPRRRNCAVASSSVAGGNFPMRSPIARAPSSRTLSYTSPQSLTQSSYRSPVSDPAFSTTWPSSASAPAAARRTIGSSS
mmetsp:Transcript_10997/g.41054  ORF Transcript_10997/g.41054 Transcript_10997/m.41054 type:complete len:301 (-) Transcript_10997:758-1660(-)|eukprot:scaffold442_cov268-Pinguiococcus_pyrenoidosus.AAC.58